MMQHNNQLGEDLIESEGTVYRVSTIFIADFAGYETLVLDPDNLVAFEQQYRTRKEAEESHKRIVQRLIAGTLELEVK